MDTCPKCGETWNFQFTFDYSKAHRPVVNILCNNCGEQFLPISKLPKKEPKQETTLEEAARKYANIIHNRPLDDEERYYKDYQKYDGFIAGAKWQQEQDSGKDTADYIDKNLVQALVEIGKQNPTVYSEEDIISLIQFLSMNEEFNGYTSVSKDTAKYYLEQFKKK